MKRKREKQKRRFGLEKKKKEKNVSLIAKTSEVRHALYSNRPIFVLLYKGAYLTTNELNPSLPSVFVDLL